MISYVSTELSEFRRRQAVVALKPEYKTLSHKKGTDLLFGVDVHKQIKKLNLTNC